MASGVVPGLRRVFGRGMGERAALESRLPFTREYLREIDIFRDLGPEEMAWLERTTRMLEVAKGQTIYRQEETAEALFLLKRGRVRLARISVGGRRLELAVLEQGTFFGEMPLLGERMRQASAEALEDCTLCILGQADIERLVLRAPRVALRMLAEIGRRLSESEARLEDLAYRTVPARLASVLLRLGREHGDIIEGVTHQDLGDMVGAYRETVTKTLDEFRAAGHIDLARRRIRLLDRPALVALLEQ
jgi:CRP/FNR family transcriptional regulator, cyclic AMP receptor protein